jgi:flagellar biosynthesis protein FlhF
MKIETITAGSLEEAWRATRERVGEDALVLRTQQVRRGGFLGFLGKQVWEIQACSVKGLPESVRMGVSGRRRTAVSPSRVQRAYAAGAGGAVRGIAARGGASGWGELQEEIAGLKQMVQEVTQHVQGRTLAGCSDTLQQEFARLLEAALPEEIARSLVRQVNEALSGDRLNDPSVVRDALREAMARRIPSEPGISLTPGRLRVVAFIGPTGVGKTTTIAKLAAHFKLRRQAAVGLVTLDTYRIAAVEQLRTYAEILDIPLRVALTPGELRRALSELAALDLVLIDTAGRSQRDSMRMNELKTFLEAAQPDEVHLVLSSTSHAGNLESVVGFFQSCRIDKMILTKLDEGLQLGGVLGVLERVGRPVVYLTNGQDVPNDIEDGNALRLARLILSEEVV